jgi:hypothetical protein
MGCSLMTRRFLAPPRKPKSTEQRRQSQSGLGGSKTKNWRETRAMGEVDLSRTFFVRRAIGL